METKPIRISLPAFYAEMKLEDEEDESFYMVTSNGHEPTIPEMVEMYEELDNRFKHVIDTFDLSNGNVHRWKFPRIYYNIVPVIQQFCKDFPKWEGWEAFLTSYYLYVFADTIAHQRTANTVLPPNQLMVLGVEKEVIRKITIIIIDKIKEIEHIQSSLAKIQRLFPLTPPSKDPEKPA